MKYHIPLLACSLSLLSPAVCLAGKKPEPKPQVSPTAITQDAAAFLDNAIDIMRQHDLHSQNVDWAGVRTEAQRPIAARLIAEGRARLATADEKSAFKEDQRAARERFEEEQAVRRMEVVVVPQSDVRKLRERK